MNKSRIDDTSRSERASKITAMAELNNLMRKAVLDKSVLNIAQFYQLLIEYESLASPFSDNKVDQLFIEQFNNRFHKLCDFAGKNVGALALARKNATDDILDVYFLAKKIFDEDNQYNPATTNKDKRKLIDAVSKLYEINHDILNSGLSIHLKEHVEHAFMGESKPTVDTPFSEKEIFFFKFVEPVLFGGKTLHALSADLYNDVMNGQVNTNTTHAGTDLSEMFHQTLKTMWQLEFKERVQAQNDIMSHDDEWGDWNDVHQSEIDDWEKQDFVDDMSDENDDPVELQQPVIQPQKSLTTTASGKIQSIPAPEARKMFIAELKDFINQQNPKPNAPQLFSNDRYHNNAGTLFHSHTSDIVNVANKILNALKSGKLKKTEPLTLSPHEIQLLKNSPLQDVIKQYDKHEVLPKELKSAIESPSQEKKDSDKPKLSSRK